MSVNEDSLLLLRVRSAANKDSPDTLNLEVEAQLNYRGIYLPSTIQLDLRELTSSVNEPGNRYGRLLGTKIADCRAVQEALRDASRPQRMRIQLMTQDCDNLPVICWERMELPGWLGPLGTSVATPFSRFAAVNQGMEEPPEDKVFHLALVVASPSNEAIPHIDAGEHCVSVVEACAELLRSGRLTITLMPGLQGLSAKSRVLVEAFGVRIIDKKPSTAGNINVLLGSKPHALQLVAHGSYDKKEGFFLLLEDEDGTLNAQKGADLINLWDLRELRLIFLESCQSAVNEANDPRPHMHDFMHQLTAAGVPGVIAMQDSIFMNDAKAFVGGFYTSLLLNGTIDEAANNGRRLLLERPGYAWAIPAVMTRLKGGAVWRESWLRRAQRNLESRIQERRQRESFPRFPLDAIGVPSDIIREHASERPNDEVVSIPLGQNVAGDLYLAIYEALKADQKVTCILGPRGSAKTRVLEDVFLSEFQNHVEEQQKALPVLLRLADCAHSIDRPATVVARAIASHLSELSAAAVDLDDLESMYSTVPFLFLIAADDDLGEAGQQQGLQLLKRFRETLDSENPNNGHRYLMTLDQYSIRVGQYLEAGNDRNSLEARKTVLATLRDCGLFDLAKAPWLLAEILSQATRKVLERTGRAKILARICSERVAQFVGPSGMRSRVEDVLFRLAWELHSNMNETLSGTEIFEILAQLRGNRDYSLVDFRSQLIDSCHIMASCGEDGIRFAYPGFQAYCCARYILRQSDEERDRLLTDITATLGRRSRVEWWEETLHMVAGLWHDRDNKLLRMILSGSPLHEGDQLNVAARCLHEARLAFGNHDHTSSDNPIVRSIIRGLMYRSDPANGRSVTSRMQASEYLGPLAEPIAIPHLVGIVVKKVRPSNEGGRYELSGGRLAAIKALLYVQKETLAYLRDAQEWKSNSALQATVQNWVDFNHDALKKDLFLPDDLSASVAAFALGLLKPPQALKILNERLAQENSSDDLCWAITDSMIELGDHGLDPIIDDCLAKENRRHYGAYLLGKLGASHITVTRRELLRSWFNADITPQSKPDARKLAGRCLLALARVRDSDILDRCHSWLDGHDPILQYYGLQALPHVGNETSLAKLETLGFLHADSGDRVLEYLRLEAYDELYWRLSGGISREVMAPVIATPQLNAAKQAAGS
jgi:hypothetical protein